MPPLPLTDVFADLPDPRRVTRNKLHDMTDVLRLSEGTFSLLRLSEGTFSLLRETWVI